MLNAYEGSDARTRIRKVSCLGAYTFRATNRLWRGPDWEGLGAIWPVWVSRYRAREITTTTIWVAGFYV